MFSNFESLFQTLRDHPKLSENIQLLEIIPKLLESIPKFRRLSQIVTNFHNSSQICIPILSKTFIYQTSVIISSFLRLSKRSDFIPNSRTFPRDLKLPDASILHREEIRTKICVGCVYTEFVFVLHRICVHNLTGVLFLKIR